MRLKEGFVLREVAGEKIVSGAGLGQIDFNRLVTLNRSAAYLWENVYGKDFSVADLAGLLVSRYGIGMDTATADAGALARQWKEIGLTEE